MSVLSYKLRFADNKELLTWAQSPAAGRLLQNGDLWAQDYQLWGLRRIHLGELRQCCCCCSLLSEHKIAKQEAMMA